MDDVGGQHRADGEGLLSGTQTDSEPGHSLLFTSSSVHSPQIQHQTGPHAWLSGLPLRNIVEEQFAVRDHGEDPLPALLHAAGLRDLTEHANVTLKLTPRCYRSKGRQLTLT